MTTTAASLTFDTVAEVTDFFLALSYRRIPARGAPVFAANGYSDEGVAIVTFARQHLADPLTYTLTEVPRRP